MLIEYQAYARCEEIQLCDEQHRHHEMTGGGF